jgi:hypothetical protein
VYEDRDVSSGRRYAYRLAYRDAGTTHLSAEVWVDVRARLDFALDAPKPNPSRGELICSFTLPDGEPARLAVFDAGGRRVLEREVGSRGGGTHLLNLTEGRRLPAGLYHVTLTRTGQRAAVRAVVAR